MVGVGQKVVFDGHLINDLFRVGQVECTLPTMEPNLLDRARGSAWKSRRYGGCTITIPLVAKHIRGVKPRETVARLMSWLDVDGVRELSLSGEGGLRRRVVPTGVEVGDHAWLDVLTLTFEQTDPYLIGDAHTVTMSTGLNVPQTFDVGGTAPTQPRITCEGARWADATTKLWQLRDGNGITLGVVIPTQSSTNSTVDIDCYERTAKVNGANTSITLASDWFELKPGTNTITLVGGNAASPISVSWEERWHR